MMNISKDIIKEATRIIETNSSLPSPIKVGEAEPVFYVSNSNDHNIVAHTTIIHKGIVYKIGVKIKK